MGIIGSDYCLWPGWCDYELNGRRGSYGWRGVQGQVGLFDGGSKGVNHLSSAGSVLGSVGFGWAVLALQRVSRAFALQQG